MKILMTNWLYQPEFSGAGMQSHRLAKALQKLGVQIKVLSGAADASLPVNDVVDDIPVRRVAEAKSLLQQYTYWKSIDQYIKTHRKQFDIVHSHGFQPRVNIAARRVGLPIVQKITSMDLDDPVAVRRRRLGMLKSKIYQMSDVVIPTSGMLEDIAKKSFLPGHKIIRIPNGVVTDHFAPLDDDAKFEQRRALGIPTDKILLISVGSITYRKGTDLLIRALAKLEFAVRDNLHLLLLGPTHGIEAGRGLRHNQLQFFLHIQQMIADAELESSVSFLERRSNVNAYLQASDVFVLASRREGQPNAVLEGMASGLPIVANMLPGITDEILQTGRFGYLVDADDDERFAAALRVLVNNPGLRRRLGSQARQEILDHYNIDTVAERYLSLYSSLVHKHEFSHLQVRNHRGPV